MYVKYVKGNSDHSTYTYDIYKQFIFKSTIKRSLFICFYIINIPWKSYIATLTRETKLRRWIIIIIIIPLHRLNSLFQTCNLPSIASTVYWPYEAQCELKRTLELIIKNALVFVKAILNESFFSPPILEPCSLQRSSVSRGRFFDSLSSFAYSFINSLLLRRDPAIKKPTDASSISSSSHLPSSNIFHRGEARAAT